MLPVVQSFAVRKRPAPTSGTDFAFPPVLARFRGDEIYSQVLPNIHSLLDVKNTGWPTPDLDVRKAERGTPVQFRVASALPQHLQLLGY